MSQTPQKQTNNNEGLPQRQRDEGMERARISVRQKEREGGPRSRSSSTSSTYKGIKSLGLTIYVKQSSDFNISSKDPRERNRIRIAAAEGVEAKFTWTHKTTEWIKIKNALQRGTLDLDEVKYQKMEDDQFDKLISQYTSYGGPQY